MALADDQRRMPLGLFPPRPARQQEVQRRGWYSQDAYGEVDRELEDLVGSEVEAGNRDVHGQPYGEHDSERQQGHRCADL